MRKNIPRLTILLATSFALAQSPAFINANADSSGASSQPANGRAADAGR